MYDRQWLSACTEYTPRLLYGRGPRNPILEPILAITECHANRIHVFGYSDKLLALLLFFNCRMKQLTCDPPPLRKHFKGLLEALNLL